MSERTTYQPTGTGHCARCPDVARNYHNAATCSANATATASWEAAMTDKPYDSMSEAEQDAYHQGHGDGYKIGWEAAMEALEAEAFALQERAEMYDHKGKSPTLARALFDQAEAIRAALVRVEK